MNASIVKTFIAPPEDFIKVGLSPCPYLSPAFVAISITVIFAYVHDFTHLVPFRTPDCLAVNVSLGAFEASIIEACLTSTVWLLWVVRPAA